MFSIDDAKALVAVGICELFMTVPFECFMVWIVMEVRSQERLPAIPDRNDLDRNGKSAENLKFLDHRCFGARNGAIQPECSFVGNRRQGVAVGCEKHESNCICSETRTRFDHQVPDEALSFGARNNLSVPLSVTDASMLPSGENMTNRT